LATFVFDAYGTLFNINAAIARHRDAAGPDVDRLSEIWRTKQLEYTWTLTLAGRYVDFWTVTERALDHALARVPSVAPALKSPLLEAYLRLDAFADAATTLDALKRRGHRTAVLSNGSPRMLDAAIGAAGFGSALDAVLSVESVGAYKPDPRVYGLVTATFKVAPAAVTFVSSNRWDIMGATSFGFRSVWINRQGAADEYPDTAPVRVLADLAALLLMAEAASP